MQMREVGTKYWVKTWSWTKAAKTKGRFRRVLLSEAHEHKALFAPQEISQNLAASYNLGPGMRKEVCIFSLSVLSLNDSQIMSYPQRAPCLPGALGNLLDFRAADAFLIRPLSWDPPV